MNQRPELGSRVALVANPSADLYGSDRMMLETVQGLVGAGWDVVVAASRPGPLQEHLERAGARFLVLPVPVVRKGNLTLRGLFALGRDAVSGARPMVRLAHELRPDVLYVNTVTIPLWLAVGRLLGLPTVNHVHEAESSVSAVARYGLTLPTRLAHLVVYNSEVSRTVAGSSGGRRRGTTVVHNGVAGPDTPPPARRDVGDPRLAYIGRLSPRKGVDVAVGALAELRARGVDATLELVGAVFPGYEWYEAELREQVRTAGLDDRVRFLGFQKDVWPHLAEADVVLIPSRGEESFGNTVVEAALSARPVVVSDHSGLREAARSFRSAVMVAPDDAVAVASAVAGLLDRWPEAVTEAAADAVTAAGEYNPRRYRDQIVATLTPLAYRRRRRLLARGRRVTR